MILDILLAKLRKRKIVKYLSRNGAVLDIGCGEKPKLLLSIKESIGQGWGVDKKTENKDWADNIHTVQQDLDDNPIFPFQDKSLDAVLMLAVLEHVKSSREALQEAFRVLTPNGILLLTTPAARAKPVLEFLAFKLGVISKEEISDHKHYFRRKELMELLVDVGFCHIQHRHFELGFNQMIYAIKK